METKTLYTLGKSTLDYDSSIPCMILKHVGFMTSEEFRAFLNKGLELAIEKRKGHEIFGWMPNLVQADAFLEEDMQWVANDFNIRAYRAGIRLKAFVLAEDEYELANISAETFQEYSMNENTDQPVIRNFKDEESAKIWLREALSN